MIIIQYSKSLYNYFKQIKLTEFLSDVYIKHIMTIVLSVFIAGYKGKTINFECVSEHHRTTVAHFLNNGKWDSDRVQNIIKSTIIDIIWQESIKTGKPIYCTIDDTIASHTKPSSKALHPIEDAYYHMSHLKGCQDYGHQAVSVLLECKGIVLNYAIIMYNKTKSKIEIAKNIANELPQAPVKSYFLCDSWYTSTELMEKFAIKAFYTIGALKTNRIIFPCGIKQKINEFVHYIRKTDANVSLVTVGNRQFYVYRYEGALNNIENAVVLITFPKEAFGNKVALRAFISTDASIETNEIFMHYTERWNIELFFRQSKTLLALDKYQIRSSQGIQRYWLLMSLTHLMCCMSTGKFCSFEEGYKNFSELIIADNLQYIYKCAQNQVPIEELLAKVA